MSGKGKKKAKKGKKPAARRGLLARLFKGSAGGKGKGKDGDKAAARKAAAASKAAPNGKPRPPTPLERSIREIKHMVKVGGSDPERLAMMLSRLLSAEKEKQRKAREDFDRMVWGLVNKSEKKSGEGGQAAGGPGDAREPAP